MTEIVQKRIIYFYFEKLENSASSYSLIAKKIFNVISEHVIKKGPENWNF